jgi:hypothetical protein
LVDPAQLDISYFLQKDKNGNPIAALDTNLLQKVRLALHCTALLCPCPRTTTHSRECIAGRQPIWHWFDRQQVRL